ncbi:MAG TPA: efflux RND transporter permease subunit, partial [Planctomycetota bacterium]|nr:efflux RND transporter permease subunit [Planctomycetota bacterium]
MIQLILRNSYLILVFCLVLFVLGIVSYTKLPADLLPTFETPAVQILTFYPGMPPEVMEKDIMSRMQRWTGQSIGISHQEGKAMLGVCIVKNFFREDVSLDTAMSQTTSYAMSDLFYLPPGTIPPMVMPFDPTASTPLCIVSVSSPTMSEQALYDVAYFELRNRLQSISGVIAPAVYGGVLRRVLAYVDRDKLEARDLSLIDVSRALNESNVLIPAGNAKIGPYDWQILANAMPRHVAEMNGMPIQTSGDFPTLIGDVGEVRDSSQIQSNVVRINGRRQAYIPIYRQPGANTISIVDAIRGELRSILERMREMDARAADLNIEVAMDQSVPVRQGIKSMGLSSILGAVLAGFVVLLFLRNLRATIAVVVAIPLAILGAFFGLWLTGATINAMTLGGLILAIGILVDQSIVVLENTVRHLRSGRTPADAALAGAREVAGPIFVSTLTFMIVFFPVMFLGGTARYLFAPLAIAATFAIVISFLLSMSLVPAFCSSFLRLSRKEMASSEHDPIGEDTGWFSRVQGYLIRGRYLIVPLALALCFLSFKVMQKGGTELFPIVDSHQFTVNVRLDTGTRIEITEERVKEIEAAIIQELGVADPAYPEREDHPTSNLKLLISNIGVLMDWPAAYTPNTGPMDAFLLVQLKGKGSHPSTFETVTRLRSVLFDRFPDIELAFQTGGMLTSALNLGEPSPIHFQISGSNLSATRKIAQAICEESRGVPGAVDVRIAQRLDYPILRLEIDRVAAADVGVTMESVVKNLVAATNSSINFDPAFWIDESNGNHYFLGVQYDEAAVDSTDALIDIPIETRGGQGTVPLRKLARMTRDLGPAAVHHHNITRVTDVYVNVEQDANVGKVACAIEAAVLRRADIGAVAATGPRGDYLNVTGGEFAGKGYRIDLRGEVRSMRETFSQFLAGLLIAVILVYLVMVPQFRSFVLPLVVMVSVDLAFVGVAAVLRITGTSFSIPVFMGLIMTVGIVVEYAILLVDYANRLRGDGWGAQRAVIEAARVRLKPILMTSTTTWIALLPLAVGTPGNEANAPLARTIIGGVISATVLTIFVVPALYV